MSGVGTRLGWQGTFRSWKQEYRFGVALPVPRVKTTPIVRADSEDEARVLLNIWMSKNGQALGGLLNVEVVKS